MVLVVRIFVQYSGNKGLSAAAVPADHWSDPTLRTPRQKPTIFAAPWQVWC